MGTGWYWMPRHTDKNQQIWNAKLVLATTGLHLAQFRQQHRLLAKAVDYADLFIYDEAQQEAAVSDLAILATLARKCLVLRLGDSKQTSGGTGPSDLARKVRLVSDQLALGIRAPRRPCLAQAIPALIQSLLQDDLPQAHCPDPHDVSMAENARDADVDGAPPIGGKPLTDALLSAESARLPLALALLQVTGDVPLRWHTAGNIVSAGSWAFAERAQDREPDLGHEAKLRDLEVVKNVHRDAALATRLKEQGPTC